MTGLSLAHKFTFLVLFMLLLLLAFTAFLACGGSSGGSSGPIGPVDPGDIFGNGNVVVEDRSVSGFSSVNLSGEGTLIIEQTGSESLRVRAEDNLLQYIQTTVVGSELEIRTEPGVDIQPTQGIGIEYLLTVDDLTDLELSGVGRIECDGLTTNRLSFDFSGVGSVLITDLDARQLDVNMSGVGDVQFSGTVTEQEVRVSGVGDYNGRGLSSSRAIVELAGASTATVRVSDSLEVRTDGSGCVSYIGNPIITGTGCTTKL